MLASRGFVYWSAEKAGGFGNRYHPGDDCTPVPSWGECHLQGYDPAELLKQWKAAEAMTTERDVSQMRGILPAEKRSQAEARAVMRSLRASGYDVVTDYAVDLPSVGVKRLSDKAIDHILNGDPERGIGGHSAHAAVPGKSRFPADWPDDKIIWAVQYACYKPDSFDLIVSANRKTVFKKIDGTNIAVILVKKKNGWRISTAYPVGDDGSDLRR